MSLHIPCKLKKEKRFNYLRVSLSGSFWVPSKTLRSLLQCCWHHCIYKGLLKQNTLTYISRLNFGSDTISSYVKGGFRFKAIFFNTKKQFFLSSPPPPTNFWNRRSLTFNLTLIWGQKNTFSFCLQFSKDLEHWLFYQSVYLFKQSPLKSQLLLLTML